jgi:cobaltochelatase CobN
MHTRILALTILMAAAAAGLAAAPPARITIVTRHPDALREAAAAFEKRHGAGLAEFTIAGEELPCAALANRHLIYVDVHGRLWSPQMQACRQAAQRAERAGTLIGASVAEILQPGWGVKQSPALAQAEPYLRFGGAANLLAFLEYVYGLTPGARAMAAPQPVMSAEEGIYHPKAPGVFTDLPAYLAWYRASGLAPPEAPLAAIALFAMNYRYGELAHIDALVAALERRGIGAVPVFAWPLPKLEPFLIQDGRPAVKLILSTNLPMPNPENSAWLARHRLRVINLITTVEDYATWKDSLAGLPSSRLAIHIGTPERTGATEPILIATTEKTGGASKVTPIAERVEAAAESAARWIRLATIPNHEKRIALIYYNNPPGKGTLGASYLNLIPSLVNLLARLRQEGYRVGDGIPGEEELKSMMLLSGRNVGEYAAGELDALVTAGRARLVPVRQYEQWFRALPAEFRAGVEAAWGRAAESRLMTVRVAGEPHFVIPGLRLGNVFLGPQPLRAELEDAGGTAHDRRTPPPHSYIAAYLWYKHRLQADALVHLGRHGTLEWLPGKDVAQAGFDAGEVLTGNLPHAYYYVVDGGGEFLQVKRRSGGVVISHLTPMLAAAGLPPDQQKLKDAVENRARVLETNPGLAEEYEKQIRAEVRQHNLDRQWEIDAAAAPIDELVERVGQYLDELAGQAIPLGIHAIGSPAAPAAVREALAQFIRTGASGETAAQVAPHAEAWAGALIEGRDPEGPPELQAKVLPEARLWLNHVRESPSQELASLIHVLAGRYLPTGVSGDPLRSPAALPTGRNMHDTDPRTFPTPAAWTVGQRMAEALAGQQRRRLGRYPEKISMVLWYGEATRHQGIAEAQALALLGVEPVWNGRGQVDGVRLIPPEKMKRPRIDVVLTMSGLYRDVMPGKVALLDQAAQLAASAPGDNPVRRNTERVEKELRAAGVAAETARLAAAARLFGPQPGVFGVGMAGMMESSRDNGDQRAVADLYLRNMGYAYTKGLEGVRIEGNLKAHLAGNQAVVHSRSTNLYGVIDNDETFQFAGGLNAATTIASGQAPDLLISNVRQAGQERFETMHHFLNRELRTRAWNPKWIEGMKTAGYAGAQQIAKEIEHLYGLRATAPEQVDADVWRHTFDVYVSDKHKLGMREFFGQANPHAQQMLAARLIEVDRQGIYRFSDADRRALLETYITSVNRQGASCYVNACANPRLQAYIRDNARALAAVPAAELEQLRRQMRASLEAPPAPRRPPGPALARTSPPALRSPGTLFDKVREFSMEEIVSRLDRPVTPRDWIVLLISVCGGLLVAFGRRRLPGAPPVTLGVLHPRADLRGPRELVRQAGA